MRVLFLDCPSGISGDMTVGALCDLGVKPSALEWELSKLEIGDFHMHFERQQRKNIEGIKFSIHTGAVHTEPAHSHSHSSSSSEHDHSHEEGHTHECCGHDHGHEHSHEEAPAHSHEEGHSHEHGHSHEEGHAHSDEHEHSHEEEPAHSHEHSHEHKHDEPHSHEGCGHDHEHGHSHSHEHGEHAHSHSHSSEHEHGMSHRSIRALLASSDLSDFVKTRSMAIFERIAIAEGKIHGQSPEDVEFHEVGALDSIADIVCACVGIEALGVEKIFVSYLHEGHGFIDCAHGRFPVPAPATLEILKGIPLGQIDEPNELITPTGAAIAAEFGVSFGLMPRMSIEKIGYGLGSRDLATRPNVLRAVLGELVEN